MAKTPLPSTFKLTATKTFDLRYGENPHQRAAVYFDKNTNSPLKDLKKFSGRDLSMVNFTDIIAGFESVRLFQEIAGVVIKHNTPCGLALGKTTAQALTRAVAADPESAFGGVVVLNSVIDLATAKEFAKFKENAGVQMDIVAAPAVTDDAADFIKKVRKTTGIYTFGKIPKTRSDKLQLKPFDGGFILQDWDDNIEKGFKDWKVVTHKKPTKKQLHQMEIAWKFIVRIRSNSVIVMDKSLPMTRGIGTGQTSRVRSTKIALEQAKTYVKGSILASDSFFPFGDSVKLATTMGIGAIIQQGGSMRDQESIDIANKAGIPMVFTGRRAFWH